MPYRYLFVFMIMGSMLFGCHSASVQPTHPIFEAHSIPRFHGWAVINGAGPRATAQSRDWHMNRNLNLSSQGGRVALTWRDGSASGYSIQLERLIYPETNIAILRLALVDEATGQIQIYAWANPEATQIGLNLGWLQVSLEQETMNGKKQ